MSLVPNDVGIYQRKGQMQRFVLGVLQSVLQSFCSSAVFCSPGYINPSNRYTPIECATSICADRGLPSLMAPAIAVAIEGQLRECIFHKPRERDGECVVAMRLRIEVDGCTEAFCLFAPFCGRVADCLCLRRRPLHGSA